MTFTRADALAVADILRTTAQAEILPRFRNLSADAIRTKSSQLDLVTDADEAAERVIETELLRRFPAAIVIGEEGVSRNARLLDGLGEADLAFILDPVDGTLNFASGLPLFGVMAAVAMKGEIVCGVILDPISDDWAMAVRGEGAWTQRPDGSTSPLQVSSPVPLAQMAGNVSWRYLPEDVRPIVTGNLPKVAMAADLRCAAHTYRQIAAGYLHFSFSSSVMPWDHAAGWLIHREAGGYTAHFDGSPYRPVNRGGGLISAPDKESWQAVRDALLPPQD
ncbi:inositol monophosphatase [Microvirga sp. 3-52]|uniref:inositol monophosphatase family protein n=1 Tax=Microvirga sp. 3-52 TaxID=2792425 RepID=UPI001AC3AFC9|nr:inositol monophosphatase family protein [Microvirga sp. 3-52]MBO1903355.1 inositol monophosphatase [Microvirga sp. 3-52]MBS7451046.1 inositol monophosphatase [Microvirga sp. 3-52]